MTGMDLDETDSAGNSAPSKKAATARGTYAELGSAKGKRAMGTTKSMIVMEGRMRELWSFSRRTVVLPSHDKVAKAGTTTGGQYREAVNAAGNNTIKTNLICGHTELPWWQ